LTTFRKAASRYARRRNEDYALRLCGGAVVRAYIPITREQIQCRDGTEASYPCECEKCKSEQCEAVRRVCDHTSLWHSEHHKLAAGAKALTRDKTTGRLVVRDEELCVFGACVYPEDAAMIDGKTATDLDLGARKAYNATDDGITIL